MEFRIKHILNLVKTLILLFCLPTHSHSQEVLIQYSKDHQIAQVHYHGVIGRMYREYYESLPNHPMTGAYSTTSYSLIGVKQGSSQCNYIYLPTEGKLKIGHQYNLRLTVWMDKAYASMPYFQNHFGIAVASDLFQNKWGLWYKQFIPLGLLETEERVSLELEFRPMSESRYLILGVFQGAEMDDYYLSDFSQHEFKLYSLEVRASQNHEAPFHYVGDPFAEEELEKMFSTKIDSCTIYFDSGSAEIKPEYKAIIDSLPGTLRTNQDLMYIYAYTDIRGEENENLGATRNQSVKSALVQAGIDSSRIVMVNYGESRASAKVTPKDRRVDIVLNMGKMHQKLYTEALGAAQVGDYGKAHTIMMKQWMRIVPPDLALTALFDCWGEGPQAERFKHHLYRNIKAAFYKSDPLKFTFDSLYLEDKKNKNFNAYFHLNRLPTYSGSCDSPYDFHRQQRLQKFANQYIKQYGFPTQEQVGSKGHGLLPEIILQNNDPSYLQQFLPVFKESCVKGKLRWDYYARLYDKVSVFRNGFQKYGTMTYVDDHGKRIAQNPIRELDSLAEFRRRVKLSPFSEKDLNELKKSQEQLDTALVSLLNSIYQADQNIRNRSEEIELLYGYDSEEYNDHWNEMAKIDSNNLVTVESILQQKGWLSPDIIGRQGNSTLFLVIQHSDLKTQMKYLPLIMEASRMGNLDPGDAALLEDRILVQQGRPQKYGTQILRDENGEYYVPPIMEPAEVNRRRKEMGLSPIEVYLRRWNIEWE